MGYGPRVGLSWGMGNRTGASPFQTTHMHLRLTTSTPSVHLYPVVSASFTGVGNSCIWCLTDFSVPIFSHVLFGCPIFSIEVSSVYIIWLLDVLKRHREETTCCVCFVFREWWAQLRFRVNMKWCSFHSWWNLELRKKITPSLSLPPSDFEFGLSPLPNDLLCDM